MVLFNSSVIQHTKLQVPREPAVSFVSLKISMFPATRSREGSRLEEFSVKKKKSSPLVYSGRAGNNCSMSHFQ